MVRSLVLGPIVDRLGEACLSRLGVVLLAAGLVLTGIARTCPVLTAGFTLISFGTAFRFPGVTGLLSRVVSARLPGGHLGVQHSFGGVSRVAFPVAAGLAMDRIRTGVLFWISGLLVLLTIPRTGAMAGYLPDKASA